ncbi:uncharacterized protein J3D65DRAFT_636931 [Phyllosticta citribraziliensis]|uniref:Uncharacterized protein n=1 Tax=Phyllosticta citribraziliensis TaxID=989973 RepID=A0ABR1LB79_9PEZI
MEMNFAILCLVYTVLATATSSAAAGNQKIPSSNSQAGPGYGLRGGQVILKADVCMLFLSSALLPRSRQLTCTFAAVHERRRLQRRPRRQKGGLPAQRGIPGGRRRGRRVSRVACLRGSQGADRAVRRS